MEMNDAVVISLKDELQKGQLAAAAAQAEARRKQEAAEAEARRRAAAAQASARRNRPQELLKETTRLIQFDELFDPQIIRFTGSLETVRAGVIRAFGTKPVWTVRKDETVDKDTVVVTASRKNDRA